MAVVNAMRKISFPLIIFYVVLSVVFHGYPGFPDFGLDPSWVWSMNEIVANQISIGRDITFTFGPYASVYTKIFHPELHSLTLFALSYFSIIFFLIVYELSKHCSFFEKIVIIYSLLFLSTTNDSCLMLLPLLVFTVFLFQDSSNKNSIINIPKNILILSVLGFLPLIKGTLLVLCSVIIGIMIFRAIFRKEYTHIALYLIVPTSTMTFFWWLSGQSLADIFYYFKSMVPIVTGYTEAMSANWKLIIPLVAGILSITLVFAFFRSCHLSRVDRYIYSLILLLTLFIAFKEGYVRFDQHFYYFLYVLVFLSCLLVIFSKKGFYVLFFISVIFFGITSYRDNHSFQRFYQSFVVTIGDTLKTPLNLYSVLNRDNNSIYKQVVSNIQNIGQLPTLEGTSDIYPWDQAFLFASGNKWSPRPCFQSYSAYTPELIERNFEFLVSSNAPDNLFFKVQTIDNRYPSLDDGKSWLGIFSNYEPYSYLNKEFILLKKLTSPKVLNKRSLTSGTYSIGKEIAVPNNNKPIFVKIDLENTIFGYLSGLIYKPEFVKLIAKLESGNEYEFRFIPKMAKTGFLISPFINSTEQFLELFYSNSFSNQERVKSIKIKTEFSDKFWEQTLFWKDSFNVSFEEIDIPQYKNLSNILNLEKPTKVSHLEESVSTNCSGAIDYINNKLVTPDIIKSTDVKGIFSLSGWLAHSIDNGIIPDHMFIYFFNKNLDNVYKIQLDSVDRPDVGNYFKNINLNKSGYKNTIDLSELKDEYSWQIIYQYKQKSYRCENLKGSLLRK